MKIMIQFNNKNKFLSVVYLDVLQSKHICYTLNKLMEYWGYHHKQEQPLN